MDKDKLDQWIEGTMHLDRLIPGEEDAGPMEPIDIKGCPFCHGTGTLDDSGESTCSKCGGSGLE